MTRLPAPGADEGTWGQILNDFLGVEHNADGTLKSSGSLASKADNSSVVHVSGDQTIAGAKTFSSSPVVPAPTNATDATNKTYVDSTLTTSLATKVPTTRVITAGTGLTGGGDLSADRSIGLNFGTGTGTVAAGDDSRIVAAADGVSRPYVLSRFGPGATGVAVERVSITLYYLY